MKLSPVIERLRQACPFFEGRVDGAVTLKLLSETTTTPVPSACVVLLDDEPVFQEMHTSYLQNLEDRFAVIVRLSNQGSQSIEQIHEIRALLVRTLAGACLDPTYDPIIYRGGTLLEADNACLSYQFVFSAMTMIRDEETAHGIFLAALPPFEDSKMDVTVN